MTIARSVSLTDRAMVQDISPRSGDEPVNDPLGSRQMYQWAIAVTNFTSRGDRPVIY